MSSWQSSGVVPSLVLLVICFSLLCAKVVTYQLLVLELGLHSGELGVVKLVVPHQATSLSLRIILIFSSTTTPSILALRLTLVYRQLQSLGSVLSGLSLLSDSSSFRLLTTSPINLDYLFFVRNGIRFIAL
jgi:hypothetical protein